MAHARASRPWHEGLLALVLAVWALWILEPVARLGHRFYLGELFHYEGPGFWFGLPFGSQLGFTATAGILLGVLFAMTRAEPNRPVDGLVHHPRLPALLTYHAQVVHVVIVAFIIGGLPADTIGGSFFLMWIPAAAVTAVHWSDLRAERSRTRAHARTSADGADRDGISRPWSRASS